MERLKLVPNRFPTVPASHRIAFIGDFPSAEDEQFAEPFIGQAGHILRNLLSNSSIHPDSVLLANISNYRPPNGYLKQFQQNGLELSASRAQLANDILQYDPNLCVLLGATAMAAAGMHHLNTTEARGTFFVCKLEGSPFYGRKCLCTYHPSEALRQWDFVPLIRLDFAKARKQGEFPHYTPPVQNYETNLTPNDVCERLRHLQLIKPTVSLDIEGDVKNVTCMSYATSSEYAFAIDFIHMKDSDLFKVLKMVTEVNRDTDIKKVLQNSLYDNFALSYHIGALIRNVHWDTMLSGWEIYPELPKRLGVQASIWTDFPAYKQERKDKDWQVHLRYCCTDSAVTYAIYERHRQALSGASLEHFQMNMAMLNVMLYMELRGTKYDPDTAKEISLRAEQGLRMINDRINMVAGKPININSPKQLVDLLYNQLKLPRQYGKEKEGKKGGLSTGVDAILNIQKTHSSPVLQDILAFRKLDKIRVFTVVKPDSDTRIRCSYNVVGTDTGRVSCSTSQLGTGTNLQTITKKLRKLYRADEGYHYFQIDLSGADGWTVAAHCARLGDRTMLDDYNFGLKPAKIIALMHEHGAIVNTWDRDKIKELGKNIGNGDTEWLYFACKRVQHGTNYGLGARTMSGQILKDGFKYLGQTIIVAESTCKQLQRLYATRYPGVNAWQEWIKSQLRTTQTLVAASGHTRRFFGRPNDIRTIQAAYSHEPQANTTYATNCAMLALWSDNENRTADGTLIIEPLHQVHDAINGQFPIDRTEWAVRKLRQYMDTPLIIAGLPITIPYEGVYGASWGDCDPNHGKPAGFI